MQLLGQNYGTPPNKVSLQTKLGAGNTMVMSELTGGVDMMGLLVFQIDESYGRYIDPDQQGDNLPFYVVSYKMLYYTIPLIRFRISFHFM